MKKLFIILFFLLMLSSCSSNSNLKDNIYETTVHQGKISIYFDKETSLFHIAYLEKNNHKWKQVNGISLRSTGKEKNFVISSDKKPYLYFGTIANPEADKIIVGNTDATIVTYNNLKLWYYADFKAAKNLSIYEVINNKKILIQP
ncbi:hypothetical protein ACFVRR_17305 [Gottfriedia sp. NPDC057948]|uniref:hypothetical protein n=1 Tax=Gottfriedia sp. NPDC057948 TaxID=3346287 RepID=UPI0036D9A8C2